MKLSRFAQLVIQLVHDQEARNAGWPEAARVTERTLLAECAAAEAKATRPRINVVLNCGHTRDVAEHVPMGYYVRCDRCNETRRIARKVLEGTPIGTPPTGVDINGVFAELDLLLGLAVSDNNKLARFAALQLVRETRAKLRAP